MSNEINIIGQRPVQSAEPVDWKGKELDVIGAQPTSPIVHKIVELCKLPDFNPDPIISIMPESVFETYHAVENWQKAVVSFCQLSEIKIPTNIFSIFI